MGYEPILVLVVVLGLFLFRRMRTSRYSGELKHIDSTYMNSVDRTIGFFGKTATVLLSDYRVRRFAKSSFFEVICPLDAVRICRAKNGQHFLWRYRHPEDKAPTVRKLTALEAEALLKEPEALLSNAFQGEA